MDRSAGLRGRRGIVVLVAGVLAVGLVIIGIQAALAGGSSTPQASPEPSATVAPPRESPSGGVTHPSPSVTPQPTPDPYALADGVYPTYVRAVDVEGATITVDVLQTFFGEDAHQAAIEDGVAWKDVRFDPVYIRNENPLLRTLPVARDAKIKMMAMCLAPSRQIGLTELKHETANFDEVYYYDVTVVDQTITEIYQRIAISAC
jgi:hypothetical protein